MSQALYPSTLEAQTVMTFPSVFREVYVTFLLKPTTGSHLALCKSQSS